MLSTIPYVFAMVSLLIAGTDAQIAPPEFCFDHIECTGGTNIGVMPATGPDACLQECISMGEDPPDGPVCGSYTFYANETLCILFEEFCGDMMGACATYPARDCGMNVAKDPTDPNGARSDTISGVNKPDCVEKFGVDLPAFCENPCCNNGPFLSFGHAESEDDCLLNCQNTAGCYFSTYYSNLADSNCFLYSADDECVDDGSGACTTNAVGCSPDPSGNNGPVGDDRGLVFVVGGQDADSDAETVDLENPVPENCDEPADFTFPAIYDAAALLMSNGAPAICGGKNYNNASVLSTCSAYDFEGNSGWKEVASLGEARSGDVAVQLEPGKWWIMGAEGKTNTYFLTDSGSFSLNVDDNAPDLPTMAGPDQVEISTFICAAHCTQGAAPTTFVAATVDDQTGQGYLWADPSGGGGAWEAVALLPVQHYGARCACFDDDGDGESETFFMVGGGAQDGPGSRDVYIYDTVNNPDFDTDNTLPYEVRDGALINYKDPSPGGVNPNVLLYLGGTDSSGAPLDGTIERIDGRWTSYPVNMEVPRSKLSAVMLKDSTPISCAPSDTKK